MYRSPAISVPQVEGNTPAQALLSVQRKAARLFWQTYMLGNHMWGDRIEVTSRVYGGHEAHSEVFTFHYVTDSHIHGEVVPGCHEGIPTCFVIDVQAIPEGEEAVHAN